MYAALAPCQLHHIRYLLSVVGQRMAEFQQQSASTTARMQHEVDVAVEQPLSPTVPQPDIVSPQAPPPATSPTTPQPSLSPPSLPPYTSASPSVPSKSKAHPPSTTASTPRPRSHSDSALNRPTSSTAASDGATATTAGDRVRVRPYVVEYAYKWRGQRQPLHKYLPVWDMVWAFVGSFLGIAFPALLSFNLLDLRLSRTDLTLIVGSFGASAVLLYSSIVSDFAQPRSVFGGHVVSAFIGVCVRKMFPVHLVELDWLACALAVSLAIVAMNLTRTLHPPGGATALIAVLPSEQIQNLGFKYIGIPIASGIACMLLVALIVNNIPRKRVWPKWWY